MLRLIELKEYYYMRWLMTTEEVVLYMCVVLLLKGD
jgi:hypothetical protein